MYLYSSTKIHVSIVKWLVESNTTHPPQVHVHIYHCRVLLNMKLRVTEEKSRVYIYVVLLWRDKTVGYSKNDEKTIVLSVISLLSLFSTCSQGSSCLCGHSNVLEY